MDGNICTPPWQTSENAQISGSIMTRMNYAYQRAVGLCDLSYNNLYNSTPFTCYGKECADSRSITCRRAAGAMLTTSFTTAVAFLATATSPVMPISAFGLYAGGRTLWSIHDHGG